MRRPLAIFALCLCCIPGLAAAQGAVLRVAVVDHFPPFSNAGEGFDVDLARRLAADLHMRLEWVQFRWPDLVRMARENAFDVAMSGIVWSPERAVIGWMSHTLVIEGHCLVGSLTPQRVAVNRGGLLERWVRAEFPHSQVITVDDGSSRPRRLAAGEVDAFAAQGFELRYLARPEWPTRCLTPLDREVFWISPRRAADLGPRIDAWIVEHEPFIVRLRQRWFGGSGWRTDSDRLIDLICRRLELMRAWAWGQRAPSALAESAARVEHEPSDLAALARRARLDPEGVRRLFALLYMASQTSWRRPDGDAPSLDLETELRPALVQLDQRIVQVLGRASPLSPATLDLGRMCGLQQLLGEDDCERLQGALLAVRPASGRSRSHGPDRHAGR
jgi:hypothetical protein